MQGNGVQRRIHSTARQQRLGGGCKADAAGRDAVIQRLDAEAVTRQEQLLAVAVPQGKGEHAMQAGGAVLAPFGIGLENNLGIPAGRKVVAAVAQLLPQFGVVVDGAVEDQHMTRLAVDHGLVGTFGKVNDREAPVPQCQRAGEVLAGGIRPAPGQLRGHRTQRRRIRGTPVETQFSTQSAHIQPFSLKPVMVQPRPSRRRRGYTASAFHRPPVPR
jgi:hypothetical protein